MTPEEIAKAANFMAQHADRDSLEGLIAQLMTNAQHCEDLHGPEATR